MSCVVRVGVGAVYNDYSQRVNEDKVNCGFHTFYDLCVSYLNKCVK